MTLFTESIIFPENAPKKKNSLKNNTLIIKEMLKCINKTKWLHLKQSLLEGVFIRQDFSNFGGRFVIKTSFNESYYACNYVQSDQNQVLF